MKLLLALFMLLTYVPIQQIETVPFESQCYDNEQCEPLDLIQYKMNDQMVIPLISSKMYSRYKNNFDSVIWQTFFDNVPIGHTSLTQKWHLSAQEEYEYTQGMVRIEGDVLKPYTHKIKGDALAYSIIIDVIEDFNQLVSDVTITDKKLFDQKQEEIREQRFNQYRTDSLNGILVYEEAGTVPDELIVLMAQKALENISGYYSDVFDIAVKGALAAEMKDAQRSVELIEEDGKSWLTLSEKKASEAVFAPAKNEPEVSNSDDWIYVSLILTVLFALIVWFFGYSG